MRYNRFFASALLFEGAVNSASDMDTAGRMDFIAMYRMGGEL
jgi:hypothetical protein